MFNKKLILIVFSLIIIYLFNFFNFTIQQNENDFRKHNHRREDTTEKQHQLSQSQFQYQLILNSINYSVNPCNDFFRFACDRWPTQHRMPPYVDHYDYYAILKEKIAENLQELYAEGECRTMEDFSEDKNFFCHCLDKERIDTLGHHPVADLLHRFMGHRWPLLTIGGHHHHHHNFHHHLNQARLPSWQKLYAQLFPLKISDSLFAISFYPNPDEDHRSNLLFEPPNFDDPIDGVQVEKIAKIFISSSFSFVNNGFTDYHHYNLEIAALRQRIGEMIHFEKQLSALKSDTLHLTSAQISFASLDASMPGIGWRRLMNAILSVSNRHLVKIIESNDDVIVKTLNDTQLTKKILQIFYSAFQIANDIEFRKVENMDIDFRVKQRFRSLRKLLDRNQLQMIKRWLYPNKNLIRELLYAYSHSPQYQPDDTVFVNDIQYFFKMSVLLANTPPHVLFNYMGWKLISMFRNYIGGPAWQVFHQSAQPLSPQPLWRQCIDRTINIYPWNVSYRYVKRFVPPEIKLEVAEMIRNAKMTFEHMLAVDVDWLDNRTKINAITKLRSIREFVAYPDWLLHEYRSTNSRLPVNVIAEQNKREFLQIAAEKLCFDRIWQLLTLKFTSLNDFNGWPEPPIIVGAYNSPSTNSIVIPFSILQAPIFDLNRAVALNDGALMPIIGHELVHSFDTLGGQFDSRGNVANWWTAHSRKHFDDRARCFVHQYDRLIEPQTGRKLNGIISVGENIADNGAIRIAYRSYKRRAIKVDQRIIHFRQRYTFPPIPPSLAPHIFSTTTTTSNTLPSSLLPFYLRKSNFNIDYVFNSDQMFFLQYAQTFCVQMHAKHANERIFFDTHSPEKYRVNVPLANFKPFSVAFQCPERSPMNPNLKCLLW